MTPAANNVMGNHVAWLIFSFLLIGCLDPYAPPGEGSNINPLVVDGSIDTSDGTVSLVLSRGVPLSSPDNFPPVNYAFVAVEDARGNVYPLVASDSGRYSATGISVYDDVKYRLHVVTGEQDEYYSDFVSPIYTPPIDSVTWTTDDGKLTIRVNAHDDVNNTKYYRWTYVETWNYHAALLSQYIVIGTALRARSPDEMIYYCWKTLPSFKIVVGSTARLSKSIISQLPVQYIPAGSKKLQMRYSILVKQTAISEEEYTYLEQLRNTTENIGGLFDPQPGRVTGNIHAMQRGSPVALGYFGAGRAHSERIYINGAELPKNFREIYPPVGCMPPDTICGAPGPGCALTISDLHEGHMVGTSAPKGWTLTSTRCADCRFEGGVTVKPDFWE
jgi:hypothetical protein